MGISKHPKKKGMGNSQSTNKKDKEKKEKVFGKLVGILKNENLDLKKQNNDISQRVENAANEKELLVLELENEKRKNAMMHLQLSKLKIQQKQFANQTETEKRGFIQINKDLVLKNKELETKLQVLNSFVNCLSEKNKRLNIINAQLMLENHHMKSLTQGNKFELNCPINTKRGEDKESFVDVAKYLYKIETQFCMNYRLLKELIIDKLRAIYQRKKHKDTRKSVKKLLDKFEGILEFHISFQKEIENLLFSEPITNQNSELPRKKEGKENDPPEPSEEHQSPKLMLKIKSFFDHLLEYSEFLRIYEMYLPEIKKEMIQSKCKRVRTTFQTWKKKLSYSNSCHFAISEIEGNNPFFYLFNRIETYGHIVRRFEDSLTHTLNSNGKEKEKSNDINFFSKYSKNCQLITRRFNSLKKYETEFSYLNKFSRSFKTDLSKLNTSLLFSGDVDRIRPKKRRAQQSKIFLFDDGLLVCCKLKGKRKNPGIFRGKKEIRIEISKDTKIEVIEDSKRIKINPKKKMEIQFKDQISFTEFRSSLEHIKSVKGKIL